MKLEDYTEDVKLRETDERISWDDYFMEMAYLVAKRATCLRRNVGAVIVKDNQVLATGYNGAPKGVKDCLEIGFCTRQAMNIPSGQRHELCNAVHAENNAIIQCAYNGVSCKDAKIYITTTPCNMCLKQIINSGITEIIACEPYTDEMAVKLLKETNVKFRQYNKIK